MKVLLLNGSPHKAGCTRTALGEVAAALEKEGVESEVFQLGNKPIQGCQGCGACAKTQRCIFAEDPANALVEAIAAADGLVVGSPVYYAGANGALCALMDRAFYAGNRLFWGKPAAAVASCRRAGSTATLQRLQMYFTLAHMPLVPAQYWPMVHGNAPEEVRRDAEGMQTMRNLGAHLAWMLRATKDAPPPAGEQRVYTNFIR